MASRPICDGCGVPHDLSADAEGKLVTCMALGSRWSPRVKQACTKFDPIMKPISLTDARRKRDEAKERRLEKLVMERWTGPSDDEGAKNGKP